MSVGRLHRLVAAVNDTDRQVVRKTIQNTTSTIVFSPSETLDTLLHPYLHVARFREHMRTVLDINSSVASPFQDTTHASIYTVRPPIVRGSDHQHTEIQASYTRLAECTACAASIHLEPRFFRAAAAGLVRFPDACLQLTIHTPNTRRPLF